MAIAYSKCLTISAAMYGKKNSGHALYPIWST